MLGVSGKYRLEQRLGGGGMAEVFLGASSGAEGFSRRVAIKRVLPGYSDNESFARMFIDEAKISSQLVHPNIVSVLDFDRDLGSRLFLVMEYVEGRDLDALASTGPLPIPVVIYVIGEVLRGLGYAHDLPIGSGMRGVVHRDVSPHNVLLSWEGAVKVSDFGIAKARSASAATASNFVKGKPAYMSPEQANNEPLDGRSDLFAVGVMLWELLIGRRLFEGDDTRGLLAAVLFGKIPRPRSIRANVPKDLERVLMKLLERDRPARYASAELALVDLMNCVDAPRSGREALVAALAERFPDHARVRQSLANARGYSSVPPTPVPGYGEPIPSSAAAASAQSLGALRNAETRTMRPRRRMFAVFAGVLAASTLITFLVVNAAVRKGRSDEPGGASGALVVSTQPAPDAADGSLVRADASPPLPPDASVVVVEPDAGTQVAVAPADAAAVPPDAAPVVKPSTFGVLSVSAFPVLTVYVNRQRRGDTPLEIKLPVGKYAIRLKNDETGYDEKLNVQIVENKTVKLERTKQQ
jgi:serine/threonine protein kinase